jgi:hypothetical protein
VPGNAGQPDAVGPVTRRTWRVDATAPLAVIDSAPSGETGSSEATIAFHSTEPDGATFRCAVDGAAAADCSSPQRLTGLAGGGHTFKVWATDAAGNEQPAPTVAGWTVKGPAPPPVAGGGGSPACPTIVTVKPIVAKPLGPACFTATRIDGANVRAITGPALVNGIRIEPRPGSRLAIEQRGTEWHVFTTGRADLRFGSIDWPIPARIDWSGTRNAALSRVNVAAAERTKHLKVLGLSVGDPPELEFSDDNGGQTRVAVTLKLPPIFRAVPVAGAPDTRTSVTFGWKTSNDLGVSFTGKATAAELWLGPLNVKSLSLGFDTTLDTFTGTATLKLPGADTEFLAAVELGADGFLDTLRRLKLEASGINKPLGATGLFLQRFGGEMGATAKGDLELSSVAAISAGPELDYPGVFTGRVFALEGGVKLTLADPWTIEATGAGKVVEVGLADGSVKYTSGGNVELGGKLDLSAGGYGLLAQIGDAWIGTADHAGDFSIAGSGTVTLPGMVGERFNGQMEALISSVGVATCFGKPEHRVGVTRRWGQDAKTWDGGCDLGPFVRSAPAGASAAQAAVTAFDVARGARLRAVRVTGRDAPSPLVLAGPGGERIEAPADGRPLQTPRALIVQDPERRTTSALLYDPKPGRWTATTTGAVELAAGLPATRVRVRVTGRGARRVLRWRAKLPAGHALRLSETIAGHGRALATTRRGRGRVRFAALPRGGRHEVVATLLYRGLPRTQRAAAFFTAPAPRLRGLRRVRGKVVWRAVPGARLYAVAISRRGRLVRALTISRRGVALPRGRGPWRVQVVPLRADGSTLRGARLTVPR